MNHGYDDSDDEFDYTRPPTLPGPSGILAQLMSGGMGMGQFARAPPPSAYDEYFKAYSVAVMPGRERPELMYGGKIIMPPSALARLSGLDIPGPWTFQLRNPRSPSQHKTHAGVLEFIADEGIVHLPAWMMKNLNLTEGDPVRLTGAKLPKGKMVKIQAQSVDFLQVSDAKAVLESALRFYSVLSKGDIIEITYNSLTFEFLIMEIYPEGPGISVIDTDLEVDFATPVGYVEPPRPAPAPIATMADKLKIDLSETQSVSAGSSRPGTSLSIRPGGGSAGGSGDATPIESFTGVGQSLSGKKVKGKGLAKKIEEVDSSSRINRNEGPRIITPDSLNDADRKVPAALILPEGKFFFGFKYIPFDPSKVPKKLDEKAAEAAAAAKSSSFSGQGETLLKRPPGAANPSRPSSTAPTSSPAVVKREREEDEEKADPWAKLGGGNTLSGKKAATPATTSQSTSTVPSAPPSRQEVIDATMLDEDDFMFDGGEDDEDEDDGEYADVIEIDSD
ncbi:hypothetical protein CI109_104935 [Kwoniella shandongensis]|uniref:Uncharacterized protein n=1 Tax=Kwoniella shandongensis TaxID=1734106 RepID=A0A5M6BRF5_9TREE|nr:uncharacterized protein CI109_006272 [Kwoniella shandongensis]KAA5525373.1 hypothetical protein CI109_006272 [Kwoniella shandongensis]